MNSHLQSKNLVKSMLTLFFGTACLYALGVCCFHSSVLTMPTTTASLAVGGIILFVFTIYGIVYMWVHRLPEKAIFLYACVAPVLLCVFVSACGVAGEEVRLGPNQHGVIDVVELQ